MLNKYGWRQPVERLDTRLAIRVSLSGNPVQKYIRKMNPTKMRFILVYIGTINSTNCRLLAICTRTN